jgi:murein peptide amidase A
MLDLLALCLQLSLPLPSVPDKLCASVKLEASHAVSVKGRTILLRDVVAELPKRRVLVLGGIHGDERSASSLVFHWIEHAQATPASSHWRFIPGLNPDGLLAQPPRRTNANGVDLNRNFPTPDWQRDAVGYWTTKTKKDPRRYPGKEPLSEPESKFLYEQIESFKPDIIVSIHAPFGVLDFDGPSTPPHKLGRLYLDQVGIYPGSLGNYGGVTLGIPVVTVELPHAAKAPTSAEMRQMWLDLVRWMSAHPTPSTTKTALR